MENINNNTEELTKAEKKEIKQEFIKETIEKEEKQKESDWIKVELTKEEKWSNFFNKIEFLSMDNEQKEEVVLKVKEDAKWDRLYWIEIFLSSWIAALWLIQNSVAVVIWAMLIAPLLRPINWVAFAVARWAQSFFWVAFKVLVISIVASILMWSLVSYLVWLDIKTVEIIARSSPNIIDFFIAIFSAMVAVLSLRYARLWESIAWVAMAASLMPPLVVVWIWLAMWDFSLLFWAMMLFLANLVAIIIVATVFFWLYWFTPHEERLQKSMFKRIIFVLLSVCIILIPLVSSFMTIRENIKIRKDINNYLTNSIEEKVKSFTITSIEVINSSKNKIKVNSTIKIPENIDLSLILWEVNWWLSEKLWKIVELELEIIRVVKIVSE